MKHTSHELTYKYLIVACIASVAISTFASYFFYSKWSESEDRNVLMMQEKNMYNQKYNEIKNSFDKAMSDLIVMRDENATIFTLHSTDSSKRYTAHVFWNHYTRQTFVDVLSLPDPDSTKQYQLWAMSNSLPVDAGVFKANAEEGVQRVKSIANADSWAVSLEPKGGSTSPTPDQIILISKN